MCARDRRADSLRMASGVRERRERFVCGGPRGYGDDGIGGDGGLSIELPEGRFTCMFTEGGGMMGS